MKLSGVTSYPLDQVLLNVMLCRVLTVLSLCCDSCTTFQVSKKAATCLITK